MIKRGMIRKKITLWRWAKPSKKFFPHEHISYKGKEFRSHNKIVLAGLKPTDWMWIGRARAGELHKIILNKEQARHCVVAEGSFRPTDEELDEFRKEKGLRLIGSWRAYELDKYEDTFFPLLEYEGGYNCPEVLIPFPVDAQLKWLLSFYLKIKARYIAKHYLHPPKRSFSSSF